MTPSYVAETKPLPCPTGVAAPQNARNTPLDPAERSNRRYIVSQPAHLSIPGAPGRAWEGSICDISSRGMQFTTERPIAQGSDIVITWHGRELLGTVRYQVADGSQYRLGVELLTSWDSLVSEVLAKQTEELYASNSALIKQTAVLRQRAGLLDMTHDAIWVTTIDGSINFWNRGAERMYGWTKAEATGQSLRAMLKTRFPVESHQVQRALLAQGRWEGELAQVRKDGSRIMVASRWALQRNGQGAPIAIMAVDNEPKGPVCDAEHPRFEGQDRHVQQPNPPQACLYA